MTTVVLRTERDSDDGDLYALASDLDSWEERGPSSPAPLSPAAYRERPVGIGVRFVVEAEGAFAGTVSLFGEDPLARHAEVGIALKADVRGRGIGSEALRQVVDFAFVRRNLRRVHAISVATNLASLGALRKAGFVEEGRRREHAWVRGAYVDEVVLGRLRTDGAG